MHVVCFTIIIDVSTWFSKEVTKNFESLTQSMCLPVEALSGSRESYSISEDELKNKYDYFGTLVALGNLRITNSQKNPLNKAIELLSNITKIVRTAGPAFSSLSGDINQDDIALEALK